MRCRLLTVVAGWGLRTGVWRPGGRKADLETMTTAQERKKIVTAKVSKYMA